jgi:hypothetical protein
LNKRLVQFPGLVIVGVILGVGLLPGCISVPNPFAHMKPDYTDLPADAMREMALEIERVVQSGDREAVIADKNGIVVSSETVKQAIKMRIARAKLVNEFLDTGFGCEQKNGLLTILRGKEYKNATTYRERDRHALVVTNENQNRWALYEGIIEASNFPRRSLSAIQQTFHQARIENMTKGQKFEDESGNQTVKE